MPQLGMLAGLVSVTFFFAALLLAFSLRMDAQPEWQRFHVPNLLWAGTVTLVLSSAAVELARYALRRAQVSRYRIRLLTAVLLAILFLAVQAVSVADLHSQGVAVAANPRGSAFYIFMAIHGAHLLAGVLWLSILWRKSAKLFQGTEQDLRLHRRHLSAAILFWHFMGILWIVLFWFLRRWANSP